MMSIKEQQRTGKNQRLIELQSKEMFENNEKGIQLLYKNAFPVGLIHRLLEDSSEDDDDVIPVLPLVGIDTTNLKLTIKYMNLRGGNPPKRIPKPMPITSSETLKRFIDQKDYDFISGLSLTQLISLINASNYLDMKGLIQLTAAILAIKLQKENKIGIKITKVKSLLGFRSDFTNEEISEINNTYFFGEKSEIEIREPIGKTTIIKESFKNPYILIISDLIIYEVIPFLNVIISSLESGTSYDLFGYIPDLQFLKETRKVPIFFLGENLTIKLDLSIIKIPFPKVKNLTLLDTGNSKVWFSDNEVSQQWLPFSHFLSMRKNLIRLSANNSEISVLELFQDTGSGNPKTKIKELSLLNMDDIGGLSFIGVNYWITFPDLERLILKNLHTFGDDFFEYNKLEKLKYLHIENLPRLGHYDSMIQFGRTGPFGFKKIPLDINNLNTTFSDLTILILKDLKELTDDFFQVSQFNKLETLHLENIPNVTGMGWSFRRHIYDVALLKEMKMKIKKTETMEEIGKRISITTKGFAIGAISKTSITLGKGNYDSKLKSNLKNLKFLLLKDLPEFRDHFFMGRNSFDHLEEMTLINLPKVTGTSKERSFANIKKLKLESLKNFKPFIFFTNHQNDFKNLKQVLVPGMKIPIKEFVKILTFLPEGVVLEDITKKKFVK